MKEGGGENLCLCRYSLVSEGYGFFEIRTTKVCVFAGLSLNVEAAAGVGCFFGLQLGSGEGGGGEFVLAKLLTGL
jgi:hypothetical protein